jgi:hypothetical protein
MKLFAVRMISNKEPVGLFWDRSASDLSRDVDDAVVNPELCEYAEVKKHFAIVWTDSACHWERGVKDSKVNEAAEVGELHGARFNDYASFAFESLKWTPIYPGEVADEEAASYAESVTATAEAAE